MHSPDSATNTDDSNESMTITELLARGSKNGMTGGTKLKKNKSSRMVSMKRELECGYVSEGRR